MYFEYHLKQESQTLKTNKFVCACSKQKGMYTSPKWACTSGNILNVLPLWYELLCCQSNLWGRSLGYSCVQIYYELLQLTTRCH